MLTAHPFGIGVGNESFMQVYPLYAVSGTETVMHAHNLFLRLTCEIGVFGLLTFLCFLIVMILSFLSKLRSMPVGEGRLSTLSAACSIMGTLVMGIFDDIWYHYGLLALFFVVCALLMRIEKNFEGDTL